MSYPPFGALANVLVRAAREEEALGEARRWPGCCSPRRKASKCWDPPRPRCARLKNEFRYQMLLKSSSRKQLNRNLGRAARVTQPAEKWNPASLVIDVDPVTLL